MSNQNKSTKEAGLNKLFSRFYETAKENLLTDGYVAHAIFLFTGSQEKHNTLPILCQFSNQEEKEKLVEGLKALAKKIDAWGYVSIAEGWMVQVEHLSKAEQNSLMTIRPSQHPQRKEAVFVALITKDWHTSKAAVFEKQAGKAVILEEIPSPPKAHMAGLFVDILK